MNYNNPKLIFGSQNSNKFSGPDLRLFTGSLIILALVTIGLAFWLFSSDTIRNDWRWVLSVQILISVGPSILASMIFYFLYSKLAEKNVLREISESSAEYAFFLFSQRFEKMLPAKIIPGSDSPSAEYQRDFNLQLSKSASYRYKGDTAKIASIRLIHWHNNDNLEKDISLLLLDPRNESLLRERAQMKLSNMRDSYNKNDLDEKIAELRNDIYTTIVRFYDNCHRLCVQVGFHNEPLFFRTEIFDNGMFVNYYLGKTFQDTYFYKRETVAYDSYLLNFRQNHKISSKTIILDNNMTDESLLEHLRDLKCQSQLCELRDMVRGRDNIYQKVLKNLDE